MDAVYGKTPMRAKDIRRLTLAENVNTYYQERRQAQNWQEWAASNVGKSNLLEAGLSEALKRGYDPNE